MDLSVGVEFMLDISPDLYNEGVIYPQDQRSIDLAFDKELLPYELSPLERGLFFARERVEIPVGYMGIIGLRSTWARLGLIAPTTFARPGWEGHLTLEIFNANTANSIAIHEGDVIWEMNIVGAPYEASYEGRYQNQPPAVVLPKALRLLGF